MIFRRWCHRKLTGLLNFSRLDVTVFGFNVMNTLCFLFKLRLEQCFLKKVSFKCKISFLQQLLLAHWLTYISTRIFHFLIIILLFNSISEIIAEIIKFYILLQKTNININILFLSLDEAFIWVCKGYCIAWSFLKIFKLLNIFQKDFFGFLLLLSRS